MIDERREKDQSIICKLLHLGRRDAKKKRKMC